MRSKPPLKAFTLIEILILVSIIAILAVIVLIAINPREHLLVFAS